MNLSSFLAAALGSVALEIAHWYNVRDQVDSDKYQKLMRSKRYWVPTALMTLLGAVVVPIYLGTGLRPDQFFAAGAAFPTSCASMASEAPACSRVFPGVTDTTCRDGNAVSAAASTD